MRVFVTGATGFVGSAVVRELLDAGHEVLGLARTDAAAAAVTATGAEPHRGDLTDLDSLRAGAAAADGVIHTAFVHDFTDFAENVRIDRRAVETLGAALASSDRPFLITSATGGFVPGEIATEHSAPDPTAFNAERIATESVALAFAERGVRVAVVRLPIVHGDGDHGFLTQLIDIARTQGVSSYVGDGGSRWAAVHRLDAAHLYRLALEVAPAGARLHAVAEEGIAFRDIAEVIGRHAGVPTASIPASAAVDHFGFAGLLIQRDSPVSSAATRESLGWEPVQPGLLADLEKGHYFGR
ncbi:MULTISPECIES: SDR family oxidoreductase [unclassified Nocardia]|uniref:SDR family oxidoreductase n=1 Tax=unclassified Nocardia TaxID=2637762 RepID=UPI001CE40DD4|nr:MULTISPECIES: SDR family oxidoreductase [unclassified Nocardia]